MGCAAQQTEPVRQHTFPYKKVKRRLEFQHLEMVLLQVGCPAGPWHAQGCPGESRQSTRMQAVVRLVPRREIHVIWEKLR